MKNIFSVFFMGGDPFFATAFFNLPGSERKCRKSSHKARALAVYSNIKSERGHVRDSAGKVFSGKVTARNRAERKNIFYADSPQAAGY